MPKEYQQLSAAQRKEIAALKQSKHRKEAGLFVMEGTRSVLDAAQAFTTVHLVATSAWLAEHGGELPKSLPEPLLAKREDMERMSAMVKPIRWLTTSCKTLHLRCLLMPLQTISTIKKLPISS